MYIGGCDFDKIGIEQVENSCLFQAFRYSCFVYKFTDNGLVYETEELNKLYNQETIYLHSAGFYVFYLLHKKNPEIFNKLKNVIIIDGWTPPHAVVENLPKYDYVVAKCAINSLHNIPLEPTCSLRDFGHNLIYDNFEPHHMPMLCRFLKEKYVDISRKNF